MNSGLSILPLPRPLGRDKATIINQPVQLHVCELESYRPTRITDPWGREVIRVSLRSQGFFTKKYDILCGQTGKCIYTIRKESRTVEIESPTKQQIATFHPDSGLPGKEQWAVLWSNTACEGEKVAINQRGTDRDRFPALVWGPSPVVLFDRTAFVPSMRVYEALVAPGADLVWISTLIVAFEILRFYKWS